MRALIIVAALLLAACGGDDGGGGGAIDEQLPPAAPAQLAWYRPAVGVSWQWQLQGALNDGYPAEIYDIDLFDTSAQTIATLQASGHRVICYFSAGSFENWRPDADRFPSRVLGRPLDGWEGERWLDVRAASVRDIMRARLDLAREKGCDGVEPDNMDGYANDPGFPLGAADQLDYNRFIAAEAHRRGLAVGLKNDLDQIGALVDLFDFSVNEQCFQYDECDLLAPFIAAGKPVLNAEYARRYVEDETARDALCADSRRRQFSTLILPLALDDGFRFSCGQG